MSKAEKIKNFDPNGVGLDNGHFIGLPFVEEEAEVILLPVPWDVTVSYTAGTATGPANILQASSQLDLYDPFVPDAWKTGIYMRPPNESWLKQSEALRPLAQAYIDFLEAGRNITDNKTMSDTLAKINTACHQLKDWVYQRTSELLDQGKIVGLVGGEHSVPLGYLEALAERYPGFGILQIDAHMDLREAYEGFIYSHASIFYNVLKLNGLGKLVQLGIRDYCEAEVGEVAKRADLVEVFFDHSMKAALYEGATFHSLCTAIVNMLPQEVYVSFDIDGLSPYLCPNTGTPVPGGLDFQQAIYLLQQLVDSGRTIIGFDVCEVGGLPHEWDGNVGARLLYRLANLTGKSQGKI
ncbi:MAG: agmatinase family protein [Bacteroidota bacterium]